MSDYDAGQFKHQIANESGGQLTAFVLQPEGNGPGEHLVIGLKASSKGVIRFNDKSVENIRIGISGEDEIKAFFKAIASARS